MPHPRAIGLLGGSFNPPHAGHRELVKRALVQLRLSRVDVLVSPQNPLKAPGAYAPLEQRLEETRAVFARMPRVRVAQEASEAPAYAVHTIKRLKRKNHPDRLVYLLGADSFADLHRWYRWRELAERIPLAVFSRPGVDLAALKSPAARKLRNHRLPPQAAHRLAYAPTPAWCFLPGLHRPESSTALRRERA